MKKYSLFEKVTATVLAVLLVIGMLPSIVSSTVSAESAILDITERLSDPATLNEWENYFGENVLSTEFSGGVWTDKSVLTDASQFRAGITMKDPEKNFLVALSALAANQQVVGYSSMPLDVMLTLDVSGSMDSNNKDTAMIQAANQAIHSLLEQNNNNRVGVVLYSGNSNTNQNAGTGTATVILPLDHYTTTSTTNIGSRQDPEYIPAYLNLSSNIVSVASGVRNSDKDPVTASKSVSGGTYIQNGLYKAWGEFSKVTDTVVPEGNAQAGAQRTPIMILMSDGQPTLATAAYNNVGSSNRTYGNGGESSTSWRTVFLTQLTAAFVKGKMEAHYKTTPKFYTVGLGTGNSDYATAVLNPATSYADLNTYWNRFFNNTVNNSGNVNVGTNGYNDSWYLYKDSNVKAQNYVEKDGYKLASDTEGLLKAFADIVEDIELDAADYVTLVEGAGEDFSGYITFTDELGVLMEVKDLKGLVLGDQLFTGHELAKSLKEQNMGTQQQPTPYGDEFMRTVQERLGIDDLTTAQNLVLAAYRDNQLHYDAQTDEYSNYIGWYSDDDGKYLGFWDKETGITAEGAPDGATWINKSYGYLGTAGSSDMMHVVVMLSTHIETGMQVMQYKIPASLIPTVTYSVELDGADPTKMKSITRNEAFPLRLVYEVGVQDGVNSVNIAQKAAALSDKLHIHTDENGNYELFTNLWGSTNGDHNVDYNDPLSHTVAQSHFHPAEGNSRYYYTEDTPVYQKQGANYVLYNGTAAPAGAGYFRAFHYYTENGYTTKYLPMSDYALQMASAYGRQQDGYWYIPEGAVFQQLDRFHMLKGGDANEDGKADQNLTDTLEYYDYPVVVDLGDIYETYAFLGNNGKLTIAPAQGIKLTKTVTETVSGAPDTFTFKVTLDQDVTPVITDPEGTILSNWSKDGKVITLTLKAGETVFITNLPTGTVYTVEEEVTRYYAASSANANGTVAEKTIHAVDFVNTPKGYGNLIISKDVEHPYTNVPDALTQKEFTIQVTLNGADVANKEFAIAGTTQTVTTDANGSFTVTLKDNGSLTILDLPEGTTFTTTEILDPIAHKGFSIDEERSTLSGTIVKDETVQTHVVNLYAPSVPVATLDVAGTKTMKDDAGTFDWSGKNFTIRLEQYDPATGTYTTIGETTVTEGKLDYKFENLLTFNKMGTYYYKVSEVIPAEADRPDGMSYDATAGRFEVRVTDNNVDGNLEFVVYDVDTGAEITENALKYTYDKDFTNIHTTDATFVEFTVDKDIYDPHNVGLSEAGYLFELFEVVGGVTSTTPAYSMRSVLVEGNGQATFHLPITKVGEWTYILKEIEPLAEDKIPGMVYDSSEYIVTVTATAQGGKLVPSVSIAKNGTPLATGENPVFTNKLELDPIVLKPYVTKTLQGRAPMQGDVFTFRLEQTNGSFVSGSMPGGYSDEITVDYTALTQNNGDAYYDEITINTVGTYYFRSIEVAGNAGGITYDSSIYHITVNVTVENGELVKNVTYVKVGVGVPSTATDSVRFVNTYKNNDTAEVVLAGHKTLTGRQLITGDFSFKLEGPNGYSETVTNMANGDFKFSPITYTAADIGTHTYTISEIDEGMGGISYDSRSYTVTVTVSDNGAGELVVTTEGADAIQFNNTYSYGGPIDVAFTGTKIWTNTDTGLAMTMQGGEFTFVLHESDETYSVKGAEKARATNAADGTFTFSAANGNPLTFSAPGHYYFLLSEEIGNQAGVGYDTAIYQIKISVHDSGLGILYGMVSDIKKVGGEANSVSFSNVYTPAEDEIIISGEKELIGHPLLDGEFEYQLFAADSTFTATGEALQTVTNENKVFAFAPITFAKSGTYHYIVKEVIPTGAVNNVYDGVEYDTSVMEITVSVTDTDLDGKLEASYTVTKNGTAAELKFVNNYTISTFTSFEVSGEKKLTGKTMQGGEFTFELYDSNGVRIEIAHNDSLGNFKFHDIPLTTLGVHTFTIKELNDGKGGITYDSRVYDVKVEAIDNGDGTMSATTPVITLNGTPATPVFENSYTTADTTAQFRAQKILENKTLQAGQFEFLLLDEAGNPLQTKTNLAGGGVVFDPITYTFDDAGETFTYTIKEVIPTDAVNNVKDGITYDTHECTVKVTVTDDGDGTLSAEVSYADLPRFTNTYNVTGNTTVDISGTKTLIGKNIADKMFGFELRKNGALVATAENTGNSFLFEDVVLDTLGKHIFTVSEVKGGTTDKGITYDGKTYTVTVLVTDNGVGGMQAGAPIITLNGVSASLAFENRYAVSGSTTVDIVGTKKLTGKNIADDMFTFELKKDGSVIATTRNKGEGILFDDVVLNTVGIHEFTVSEVKGGTTDKGITYSNLIYTVKVEVVDNGDGTMSAKAPVYELNGNAAEMIFTNEYKVSGSTTVDIVGTKKLTGKDIADDMFTFELKKDGSVIATTQNKGEGILFDDVVLNTVGIHEFTVSEVKGGTTDKGITYSNLIYTVKVEVVDNGDGTMSAKAPVYELNGNAAEMIFTNEYKVSGSTTVDIVGTKKLTGKDIADGMFTFELKKDGSVIATTQNKGEGILFDDVVLNTVGIHEFTVSEVKGGTTDKGITYSNLIYTVKVEVVDNGDGTMSAKAPVYELNGNAAEMIFTNEYKVSGSTTVDIVGTKKLTGKNIADDMFTFELKKDGSVIATTQNKGEGILFDDVVLNTVGTHEFTVSEVKGGTTDKGITYSNLIYTVKVEVVDNGDGTMSAKAPVYELNGNAAEMVFTNEYKVSGSTTVDIVGTKKLTGKDIADAMFTFELKKDGSVIATTRNKGEGILFDDVVLNTVGIHEFTVSEVKGGTTDKGITYDGKTYTVTVEVVDNGDGTMSAKAPVYELNGNAAEMIFTNEYKVSGSTTVDIVGTKKFTGKDIADGMFTFELKKDGSVIATTQNKGEGILFDDVVLNTVGTHEFTVSEVKGGTTDKGITYDGKTYTVTVEVVDNGDGTMSAKAPVYTLGGNAAEMIFTNEYKVSGSTSFDLSGSKKLTGKEIKDGMFTFELYEGNNLVMSAPNAGETFRFTAIPLTTLGEHTFTLVEKIPADAVNNVKDGITYSDLVYTIKINVTDDGEGGMTAGQPTISLGAVPAEKIEFVNRYNIGNGTVDITGTKTLTGKELADRMFTFELWKDGQQVGLAQNVGGTFTFQNVELTATGTTQFTLRELIPAEAVNNVFEGITYSTLEYIVEVTATDNGAGGMAVSEPVFKLDGNTVEKLTFVNVFTPEEPPVEPQPPVDPDDPKDPSDPTDPIDPPADTPANPNTGDDSNLPLYVVLFGISAMGIVVLLAVLVIDKKHKLFEE